MNRIKILIIVIVSTLSFLAACSGKRSAKTNKKALSSQPSETATSEDVNLSPRALQGKKFANHGGCMDCHTTNGKVLVGPTFKNLYGHKVTLKDGSTIIADSAYIIQSMKHPSEKIVAGYSPVMPKYYFMPDRKMRYIVAYIKSLSDVHSDE